MGYTDYVMANTPHPFYESQVLNANQRDPNKIQRVILYSVGALLIFFLLTAAYLAIFTQGTPRADIADISAKHREISRISDLATKSDRASTNMKYAAANVLIISMNSSSDVEQYMAEVLKKPISSSQEKSARDKSVDDELDSAGQVNDYDDTYRDLVIERFEEVNNDMTLVIQSSKQDDLKRLLNDIILRNEDLVEQLEAI